MDCALGLVGRAQQRLFDQRAPCRQRPLGLALATALEPHPDREPLATEHVLCHHRAALDAHPVAFPLLVQQLHAGGPGRAGSAHQLRQLRDPRLHGGSVSSGGAPRLRCLETPIRPSSFLAFALACGSPQGARGADPAPTHAPTPTPTPPTAPAEQPARVVAIGDLHGDLDNALRLLHQVGLTDPEGRWTGGSAVLVQTGDVTDRGPDSGALLALMRRLGPEAAAAGGRVVPLLGNHEVMNLHGDWRYVDPGDVLAYGGEDARKKAYAPDGEDGRWILGSDVVARVGDAVFVHGGVTKRFAELGVDGINEAARAAMRAGGGEILESDGPLWYRGYVTDPEASACPALADALDRLGANRMVVGHTTRKDGRIEPRCDGRLLVIDIGVADHYGAHLGALELAAGDARAWYPTGPVDLPDPK